MSTSVPRRRQPEQLSLESLGSELRPIVLALAAGALLLSVIVLLTFTQPGSLWGGGVVLIAGLVMGAAAWTVPGLRRSPLHPGERADPAAAAGLIRTSAILAMAFAETPALLGLVIGFVTQGWLPALIGGVLGTAGLLVLGPTKSRLAAWRDQLEARGARTGL